MALDLGPSHLNHPSFFLKILSMIISIGWQSVMTWISKDAFKNVL